MEKSFSEGYQKVMGIDYGKRRVGLSLSDDKGIIAFPYKIVENKGKDFLFSEIESICQREKVGKIIIGLPLGLSGAETRETLGVKEFIEFLKDNFNIPVETGDERLTSKMAENLFSGSGNRQKKDAIAAAIILQNYLDRRKNKLNSKFKSQSAKPNLKT